MIGIDTFAVRRLAAAVLLRAIRDAGGDLYWCRKEEREFYRFGRDQRAFGGFEKAFCVNYSSLTEGDFPAGKLKKRRSC